MKYPLRNEYQTAVKYLDKFVFDSVLKKGKPVMDPQNPKFLLSSNGGKAIVYQIQTNPKKYALKCWVEDLGDLKIRYQTIDNYQKTVQIPYFVDFAYREQGILVNGKKFPIIRMEWVEGISFKQFISNNIKNPVYIRDFAEEFLEMVKILHQNNISHGDLQHGNIMMRKNGDICLIDYDSLYVPQLKNEEDNIKGLPGYQHPNRKKLDKLSPKSDYFSELIIYLSLLVISEKPSYWQQIEQQERLLFSETDLCNSRSSKIFGELAQLSDEIRYFTLELDKFCRETDLEKLQPLENLVTAYTGTKVSWDFPANQTPNLSSPSTPPTVSINPNDPAFDIFENNQPQANTANVNVQNPNPWGIFDNNSSSTWGKFDQTTPSGKDPFGKFDQPTPSSKDPFGKFDETEYRKTPPDESIWDKFENIWDKFTTSVSSIWNKILNWFN